VELDHVFLCTSAGAPEAERLLEFGLTEGSPNRHPGQGTANRRFFFGNAFLELLWVEDPLEVQSPVVRRTGLWERWSDRGRGASPFGIGFRPGPGAVNDATFPTWEYRPPYLPDPLAIHMGCNSEVTTEPLLFYLPFGRRPDLNDPARWQPREHAAGVRSITRVRLVLANPGKVSPMLREVGDRCQGLQFASGADDLMEIGFDSEVQGRSKDFRPALPLVLSW
jgi:hypothetical protein